MTGIETKQLEIYAFWRSIPLIKKVSYEKFEQVKQETRNKIIEILRTGIEDKYGEFTRRYALNAQEIQDILIKKGIKTSVQNTYFHINILLEEGLIQEIAIIKEGRFNKRYYGRTAKLFLFTGYYLDTQERFDKAKMKFLTLIEILTDGNRDKELEKNVESYLNERIKIFNESEDKLYSWFEQNADKIIEYNIDVKDTYEMLVELVSKSGHSSLDKKMMELLKI